MRKIIIIEAMVEDSMTSEEIGNEVFDRLESMFGGEVSMQFILSMQEWSPVVRTILRGRTT